MKLSNLTTLAMTLFLSACGAAISPDDGGADAVNCGTIAPDPWDANPTCGCGPAYRARSGAEIYGTSCADTGLIPGQECISSGAGPEILRTCVCGLDARWYCEEHDISDGDVASCNTLPLGAQVVATRVAAPLPTPEGGQLVDGTYQLTAITEYGPDSPDAGMPLSLAATMQLAEDKMQLVNTGTPSSPGVTNQTWQFVTDGAHLTRVRICGDGPLFGADHFDVTPTGVRLYGTDASGTRGAVFTFTRQ